MDVVSNILGKKTPGRRLSDSYFNPEQLTKGTKIEMEEHGVYNRIGKGIAKDHIYKTKTSYK